MSLLNIFKKSKQVGKKEEAAKPKIAEKKRDDAKAVPKSPEINAPQKQDVEKKRNVNAYRNIIRPVVTEKSAGLASENKYVFEVGASMNKIEIKKAIKDLYGVAPVHVRTLHVSGRDVRYGRTKGRTSDWKKAIVSLKKGDKIEVYEGV